MEYREIYFEAGKNIDAAVKPLCDRGVEFYNFTNRL